MLGIHNFNVLLFLYVEGDVYEVFRLGNVKLFVPTTVYNFVMLTFFCVCFVLLVYFKKLKFVVEKIIHN